VLNYHRHPRQHRHVHVHRPAGFQRSIAQHVHEQPRWQHDPQRRRGVAYRHPQLQERYGRHEHPRSAPAGTHGGRSGHSTSAGFTRSVEQRVRDGHRQGAEARREGGELSRPNRAPGAGAQQPYGRPAPPRSALAGTHGARSGHSTSPGFTRSIEQRVRDAQGAEARVHAGEPPEGNRPPMSERQRASSAPTGRPSMTADRLRAPAQPSARTPEPPARASGFAGTAARRAPITEVHPQPAGTAVQRREMARLHPAQTPSPVMATPSAARAQGPAPAVVPAPGGAAAAARAERPARGSDRDHEVREQASSRAPAAAPAGKAGMAPRDGFQGVMGRRMERER
jgi:hypothetical protein